MPSAEAMPRTKVVLPAPILPTSARTPPWENFSAIRPRAILIIACGECAIRPEERAERRLVMLIELQPTAARGDDGEEVENRMRGDGAVKTEARGNHAEENSCQK